MQSELPQRLGDAQPKTVSIYLGFFFMVNFVLGTGFLGIPFGFFHGGLVAGFCTLLVVALIAWLCALWELEGMARAQALYNHKVEPDHVDQSEDVITRPEFYISVKRKFEPSEMCEIFVGRWLKIAYLIIFTVYCSLACLSYATVAASAWSVNIPLNFGTLEQCNDQDFHKKIHPEGECQNAYRFCLVLFAVLVIPVSLLDLKEQVIVQVILGLLRFLTLGAIIIYCFIYLVLDYTISSCDDVTPIRRNTSLDFTLLYDNDPQDPQLMSIKKILFHFDFNGWVVAIPVFVYAYILHQGIPGLTHPIKEKKWLRGYFNILFLTITVLYATLGVVVSLWFRDCTNEICTLKWKTLTSNEHTVAIRALSYYIILFPSVDVCSVFPLIIHTIVNNIYTVIFGRDTSQVTGWKHYLLQILMKFISAVIPIFVALFVSNLVYVLKYAGLTGFFIAFFFPIVFQLTSQWVCCKTFSYMTGDYLANSDRECSTSLLIDSQIQDRKEDTPLVASKSKVTVSQFFFSRKNAYLYMTPYSTVFSYPLCVLFIAFLSFICITLSVVSLFVHTNINNNEGNSTTYI